MLPKVLWIDEVKSLKEDSKLYAQHNRHPRQKQWQIWT